MCVSACPPITHAPFLRAVVCGEPLPTLNSGASLKGDFVKTGLIHLLVVSGSHLVGVEIWVRFLSKCLRMSRLRDAAIFSSLVAFTLMTLATPPVLRALFSWMLMFSSSHFRLGWTRAQILTMSGAFCLSGCRTRWDLGSLILSWLASLGLAFSTGFTISSAPSPALKTSHRRLILRERTLLFFRGVKRDLIGHISVYVTLIPALIPMGVPSLASIACNLVFAPVMGFVLFPISVLGYAGLATLADRIWSIALAGVSLAARHTPEPWSPRLYSPAWLVPYVFALSLLLIARERRAKLKAVGEGPLISTEKVYA